MSKRVVKKKAEEVAAPPPDVKSTKNSIPPAASANPVNDVRVAQQMRVMEVVGANASAEKDDKKYSPRTEVHIKQLMPLLDHYEYSRADIASLVKRCHHDEMQIQIAVANVIEDRANHEATSWGEVKTKKQLKEAKKLKEEEEQREQERLEKELEKQRKDAEKRAAREAAAARKNGKAGNSWGADPSSLPPDPAILFAGAKPVEHSSGGGDDEWWGESFSSNWAEWDDKDDGADWNKENGKDWEWHKGQWDEDEWEGGKAGDEWWSGDWEKAGGRGKRGAKEQRGRGGGARKAEQEPKDSGADMWDMPDIAGGDDKQAGLDQWTLGDIRAYDGPGASREDEPLGLPKVPPTGMRTVEEIEKQYGTGGPPTAPPMGLPPGKARIDSLFQETNGLPPPKIPPEDGEGKGKGKGKKGGKGKHKDGKDGERPERSERPRRERDSGEGDDGHDKQPLERIDRSDDPRRQAIEEVGEHVTVKKHSSMGCAVISLRDPRVREAMLVMLGERTSVAGTPIQLKPHFDKDTKIEVVTDIFAAWGRQAEKNNPLPERELMKFFEGKHAEIVASWREEAEEKARAEDRVRQQKLLEEQQRQAQEQQREREDQRRVFEELKLREEAQRQQLAVEAQRKALEDQARQQSEQMRIHRETKAKMINDLQGNWAQSAGMLQGATSALDPRVAASLGGSNATQQALAAAQQQAQQSRETASTAGLNPAASAYTNTAQAQAQWQAQWMQAMYNQNWQQQMAQQQMAQRSMAQAQAQQMGGQDYETQMRTQAAYYAYLQEAQRGHTAQSAAYAQQQQQQAAGYMSGQQQAYAAAAYGQQQRGERI
mmetsp:Transcript_64882/g.101134  ORF Transcript_64882/g.101134 Transcript_64882/m.101134 type:complete len:826 (-) Transcript_64882:100-2577(-)